MSEPKSHNYSPPLDQFLTLGDVRGQRQWLDYAKLGITAQQTPYLILLLQDQEIRWADSESDQVWAPIHAWRALGQLRVEEAIEPLILLLREIDEYEDDWSQEEVPVVLGMIGPAAIPAVKDYLFKSLGGLWADIALAASLKEIGERHPDVRTECVIALLEKLADFRKHDETLNAFIISYLADMKATEAAQLVERAYQADSVDISIIGDYEDFQIAVGLLEKRLTPPPSYFWAKDPQRAWEIDKKARQEEERRQRQKAQKEKKKHKQAKKTRRGKRGKRK